MKKNLITEILKRDKITLKGPFNCLAREVDYCSEFQRKGTIPMSRN